MTAQPRREVVGILTSRSAFESAITALQAAGFDRNDLSVLASHESLDAAGPDASSWRAGLPALLGELRYQGPLLTAGIIALAAGPVGAVLGAVIAAGVGGAATLDLMAELTARPHGEAFAEALRSGALLLWVEAPTADREAAASAALTAAGALNVHLHQRDAD